MRDQIDNYTDTLNSLHHKMDQIMAYCMDKKEREEVNYPKAYCKHII